MTDRVQSIGSNGAGADVDAAETGEWLEAIDAVVAHDGPARARQILQRVVERAQHAGTGPIASLNTPYVNTIPVDREAKLPGDPALERRLRSIIRWNAMAMVVRANKESSELGGHIATYQSVATLYEVGFNHFWRAPTERLRRRPRVLPGPLVAGQLRARVPGGAADRGAARRASARRSPSPTGSASYPHPWLMPDFWQFPTVSLGLGAITSIYQARFMKYLEARGIAQTAGRKVWAFIGDGEVDEPETMGSIGLAGREHLDNLIWVVNANLQRLDGPVRGNGKIIQELESDFRGAGWNVIKVIWGSRWDPLLAADTDGRLVRVMEESVDGEYQTYKSRDGAYVREHFFGKDPVLLERVSHMSDDEIWLLNRGGLDQQKVYAAYHEAVGHTRPADRDPRQDDQGLRDGRLGRGPDDHPSGEEDDRGRPTRFPRPLRAAAHRRAGPRGGVLQAAGRLPGDAVPARVPRGAGRKPPGAAAARRAATRARARAVQGAARGNRRQRDLDDDGFRARARGAAARQADRPPHRPDRARRVAHVRDGGPVPPDRDLLARTASSTSRRTQSS